MGLYPVVRQGIQPVGVGGFLEEDLFRHGRCFPVRGDEQRPGEEDLGGWAVAGKEGRTWASGVRVCVVYHSPPHPGLSSMCPCMYLVGTHVHSAFRAH